MKNPFKAGSAKVHTFTVSEHDVAQFETGLVHRVCSTFKLAQEMEWSSRLLVLDMIESDEEGVGTSLEIKHISPAFVGDQVKVTAIFNTLINNELICEIEVNVGDRKIAMGKTGQKILSKHKISQIFNRLEQ